MALNWKKVKDQDTSKAWKYFTQNFSLLPNSLVYIHAVQGTGNPPADGDEGTIRLIGRQILYLDIQPGTTLWYAETDGGIFVSSKAEKFKLKNYDIPTTHTNVTLQKGVPHTFKAPEGSNVLLQNLSDRDVYFNVSGGNGSGNLTKNQVVILPFAKETDVSLNGTDGDERVTILIQQSIAVTELSDENKELLEDIVTRMELLENAMARKEQLEEVEKRTYHDKYSIFSNSTGANTQRFESEVFKCMVEKFRSAKIETDTIINGVIDLDLTWNNGVTNIQEKATIDFKLLYKESEENELLDIYCSNKFIHTSLTSLILQRGVDKDKIRFVLEFNKNITSMTSLRFTVRADNHVFEIDNTEFNIGMSTTFPINLYNANLHFTDDEDLRKMSLEWDTGTDTKSVKYKNLRMSIDTTTDTSFRTYIINSDSATVKLHIPLDESECSLEITQPIADSNKALFLNFIPNEKVGVLTFSKNPVTLNAVIFGTLCSINRDDVTITTKYTVHKHTLHGYTLIEKLLRDRVSVNDISKFILEIIGTK